VATESQDPAKQTKKKKKNERPSDLYVRQPNNAALPPSTNTLGLSAEPPLSAILCSQSVNSNNYMMDIKT